MDPLGLVLDPDRRPSRFELALASGRVACISPALASALNRDDLGGYNPPGISDPYSNPQTAAGPISAASALDTGRVSVLMIGILVLAGAGFYIWTRRFQS